MPRCLAKKDSNSQNNISPIEPRNPTIIGPEKYNIAETYEKGFKISIMNMFKDLKEPMNKSISKIHEYISSGIK